MNKPSMQIGLGIALGAGIGAAIRGRARHWKHLAGSWHRSWNCDWRLHVAQLGVKKLGVAERVRDKNPTHQRLKEGSSPWHY